MNADHYFPFFNFPFPVLCFSKLPLNPGGEEISGVLTPSPGHCSVKFLAIAWGPFLESPGNFTGPKSNIQIEI